MNVLFLTHSFPRIAGDAPGSFILRLAVALRGEGVEVHVVAPAAPGLAATEVLEGITVERFRYAPRRFERLAYTGSMAQDVASSWSARLALVGFLGSDFVSAVRARRSFQPSLIHAHWWFPSGVIGTWTSRLSGCPLVTTLHGTDVRLARSAAMSRPLFRHVLQHSAAVTAVSSWLADNARTLVSGVDPLVAPMPVDTARFVPGNTREPARFLFVGRLNQQKGLGQLIRAMPLVRPHASLDVVGEGSAGQELRALAERLGVAQRMTWHGQLKADQLAQRYRAATALVFPSAEEGLGLVAVEALLCETPVVAYSSGGVTDVIRHDRTGLLVPAGDVNALAGAMNRVLDQPVQARTLGEAGRMYALANFAPETAARRYADVYRRVLGRKTA